MCFSFTSDIDECKTEKRCGESAGCLNTEGSYRCICSTGFELKSGDSNIRGTVVQCEGKDANNTEIQMFNKLVMFYSYC